MGQKRINIFILGTRREYVESKVLAPFIMKSPLLWNITLVARWKLIDVSEENFASIFMIEE
jgi:hypothetical protein